MGRGGRGEIREGKERGRGGRKRGREVTALPMKKIVPAYLTDGQRL